jgi:hypothetical protein
MDAVGIGAVLAGITQFLRSIREPELEVIGIGALLLFVHFPGFLYIYSADGGLL